MIWLTTKPVMVVEVAEILEVIDGEEEPIPMVELADRYRVPAL